MPVQIGTPDSADSKQTVTLNKKSYRVRFLYCDRSSSWNLSIFDAKNNSIILGEKILPYKEFLSRYNKIQDIGGYFYISSFDNSNVTRDNLGIGKTHTLSFVTFEEIDSVNTV